MPELHTEVWPVAHDVTELIGHTPLIELRHLAPGAPEILIKHEGMNPGGSIRDRTVLEILDNAFASGLLRRGDEVVIAGATNSAVAACVIAHARGCTVTVFHPATWPGHLLGLLRSAGAALIPYDGPGGLDATVLEAANYAREHHTRIFIDAGRREALQDAVRHIAREIIEALDGHHVGAFVTSFSTGSTLRIVSHELRVQYPELTVIGVKIATPDARDGFYDDVAPSLVVDAATRAGSDAQRIAMSEREAWQARALIARTEGLLLGPKGASAALTALRVRASIPGDRAIVALSIDAGGRYFGAEPPEVREDLAALAALPDRGAALAAMDALIGERQL